MASNGDTAVEGPVEGGEQAAGAVEGPVEGGEQAAAAGGGRTGWQTLRSVLFQLVVFYFIMSFFRGRQQQPPPDPEGRHPAAGGNLFPKGQDMGLFVYLTEWEDFNVSRDHDGLVWNEDMVYGDWTTGLYRDGCFSSSVDINVPETVQQNGTWYLHLLLVKVGYPMDPEDEDYSSQAIVHSSGLFNKYKKRHLHNTVNLITGEADVAPGSLKVPQGATDVAPDILSYYHPNLTINLVDDHTHWTPGAIPQPMDKFIEFDYESGGYFPILYMNDYWNLAQEYMPLNETTPSISITLSFVPLTMFKFNMYAAMSHNNPWYGLMNSADQSDEEQDSIKQTLLETNPYLLGLTVAVSILHSVFEFLAFKNDVQFWRSRKTLEGLSVRSIFFNVFQSLIVLLYILDNETNFVIIISVFVGLLIELWKVTKVVEIKIDRVNMIAGVIPRVTFVDRPSYQSSTKKYDMMAFKYLGMVLFPLFVGYGVYSLFYLEHKGWYSFALGMSYGFLLTFGFITMTPQLFINYKLKSVAHLPWRMLTYKALNTFIDDMFAFVIKMPTMYRIGCFRDDIVFFIFLYQRWIYRVDPKRVNEFGTTGDDSQGPSEISNGSNQLPSGEVGTDKKKD